jgi:hypothetical protein
MKRGLKVIYSDERRIERREIPSDLVYDLLFHNSSGLGKFRCNIRDHSLTMCERGASAALYILERR